MPQRRRRPRGVDPETALKVKDLALRGFSGREIHGQVQWVSLRTIYRLIEDVRPPDPSGLWKPLRSLDSAAVLPVLAAVVERTEGRIHTLTNAEATHIATLREAFPELPPWETYCLAQAYVATEFRRGDTDPIDTLLAFAPWRSEEHAERYFGALNRGWAAPPADDWFVWYLGTLATGRENLDSTPEIAAYTRKFIRLISSGEGGVTNETRER